MHPKQLTVHAEVLSSSIDANWIHKMKKAQPVSLSLKSANPVSLTQKLYSMASGGLAPRPLQPQV